MFCSKKYISPLANKIHVNYIFCKFRMIFNEQDPLSLSFIFTCLLLCVITLQKTNSWSIFSQNLFVSLDQYVLTHVINSQNFIIIYWNDLRLYFFICVESLIYWISSKSGNLLWSFGFLKGRIHGEIFISEHFMNYSFRVIS